MDSSDGFLHERSRWMKERRFVDVKWAGNKEKRDFLLPVFYVSWNLPCVADKYFVFLIAFLTLTLWGNFEVLVPQSNTFLKPIWRPVACLRMRERETEQTSCPLSLSFSLSLTHTHKCIPLWQTIIDRKKNERRIKSYYYVCCDSLQIGIWDFGNTSRTCNLKNSHGY